MVTFLSFFFARSRDLFLRACVCVRVVIPFILDVRLVDAPAGVTQEKGHTGFLIHLPSMVLAFPSSTMKLNFVYRRI